MLHVITASGCQGEGHVVLNYIQHTLFCAVRLPPHSICVCEASSHAPGPIASVLTMSSDVSTDIMEKET
jgi:hypothetical protein